MSSLQTSMALSIVRGHFWHPKEMKKYPLAVKEKDISPPLCPARNVLTGTFGKRVRDVDSVGGRCLVQAEEMITIAAGGKECHCGPTRPHHGPVER